MNPSVLACSLTSHQASEPRISLILRDFLLLLPLLIVCELALFSGYYSAEATARICFFLPAVEGTFLACPGLFPALVLLVLLIQQPLFALLFASPFAPPFAELFGNEKRDTSLRMLPVLRGGGVLCGGAGLIFLLSQVMPGKGIPLSVSQLELTGLPVTLSRLDFLCCLGAGVYEEICFRLILFSGLAGMTALVFRNRFHCLLLAMLVSSFCFALAHESDFVWGVSGFLAKMQGILFAYRFAAGLLFCWVMLHYGLLSAVGLHFGLNLTLLFLS